MSETIQSDSTKWVEVIYITPSPEMRPEAVDAAKTLLAEFAENTSGLETLLMRDVNFIGNLEAILLWDNNQPPKKSMPGFLLVEQFRKFGMTNHDVWQLIQGSNGVNASEGVTV